jgi:predicted O-methyltransferase YrrM
MDIFEYVKENKLKGRSAINQVEFRDFFKDIKIKTIVEIGTYKGASTAYMAQFAKKIFTFDIRNYRDKYKLWKDLGIDNKIHYFTIKGVNKNFAGSFKPSKNRVDIKDILKDIRFDFAFIDGEHTYEAVRADFELVKHCGRVLFHDVNKKAFAGVRKFADEIGVKVIGNIAYWQG